MKIVKNVVICTGLLLALSCSCEKKVPEVIDDSNPYFRFMFYNVENLFDTINNPDKPDEEFLPGGDKKWNSSKYYDKLNKIAKVIKDVGGDKFPPLVGLCEIESLEVLEGLTLATDLKEAGYNIVHKESPDYRGIDVAFLYRPDVFELDDYKTHQVWFPFDEDYSTREILYVKGRLKGEETVHIFINHWPSRSGGETETRPKRVFVAEMLRTRVDSILLLDRQSRIIITGDFNDEPTDLSIVSGLSTFYDFEDYGEIETTKLYNPSHYLDKTSNRASYKFKGNWNMLDQFIVSGALMDTSGNIYCRHTDVHIFDESYLLEKDDTYLGDKPFRSFLGDFYHGGYSDHLPVYLDLRYKD